MLWWIVCLTIISVVRVHISTPHPSHTHTQFTLTSLQPTYFLLHLRPSHPGRNSHIHLSLSPPPQQSWPLPLHLSPFYTHTQQGGGNNSAPCPPWLCQCFIMSVQDVALQCCWNYVTLSYSHLAALIITSCDGEDNCEFEQEGHKAELNWVWKFVRNSTLLLLWLLMLNVKVYRS